MKPHNEISIQRTGSSLLHTVDWHQLEFGKHHADHMFLADYSAGQWHSARIKPFGDISLSPTTLALHYGQTIFEGMKALRMHDGRVNIFRPTRHAERMSRSAERMCMTMLPQDLFLDALQALVEVDRDWVPKQPGGALYIRPFIIASEARMGVKISEQYAFIMVSGPVGALYHQPLRVKVETEYVRAAKGGTGYAKCGGNYGAAFYPTQKARQQGYDQVLWTDSRENKYIEESGTMNVMFVIEGKLVTPPLSDSILDGVTRDSFLTLARAAGIRTEERPVSIDELRECLQNGQVTEAFGVGTAAVTTSIKTIGISGVDYMLPAAEQGIAARLKMDFEDIRTGKSPDLHGWNWIV